MILFLIEYYSKNKLDKGLYTTSFSYWMITRFPRKSDLNIQKFKEIKAICENWSSRNLVSQEETRELMRDVVDKVQDLPPDSEGGDEDFDLLGGLSPEADDMVEASDEQIESRAKARKDFFSEVRCLWRLFSERNN